MNISAPDTFGDAATATWRFVIWVLATLAVTRLVRMFWDYIILPITRRTSGKLDTILAASTRVPVQWVLMLAGLKLGALASFEDLPVVTNHICWRAAQGALYVMLALASAALIHAVLKALVDWYSEEGVRKKDSRIDDEFLQLFRKLSKLIFFFIAATIILDHFGVKVTALLATAGVASLAVAFAAQETIANMISGLALMVDRTFRTGDRIELSSGKVGDVLDIGLRSTRILSYDNTVINVPNAELAKSHIINLDAPTATFAIRYVLGVAYGSDLRKVKSVLHEIFAAQPEVLDHPAPSVYFIEFGESSLNLLVHVWIADSKAQFRIRDAINMTIKDRFEQEGISIPFPQRDVHVMLPPGGLPDLNRPIK